MSCHAWLIPVMCQTARKESCATASESSKVAIIAPRDEHASETIQSLPKHRKLDVVRILFENMPIGI